MNIIDISSDTLNVAVYLGDLEPRLHALQRVLRDRIDDLRRRCGRGGRRRCGRGGRCRGRLRLCSRHGLRQRFVRFLKLRILIEQ